MARAAQDDTIHRLPYTTSSTVCLEANAKSHPEKRHSTMALEDIAWRTTARWSTLSTVYPEAGARGMAARESELRMVRTTAGYVIQR